VGFVAVCACAEAQDRQFAEQVEAMAEELAPEVERAVGLDFRYPANVAVRTREDVYDYLRHKMEAEFPPEELERLSTAYRLFRMIPEDLDLNQLILDLYTEQVVGFYDPQSDTLYVVTGAESLELRLIVGHELVHALQAQYVPLDSILTSRGDNDRRTAAQAVFEGQGVIASLHAMMPDGDLAAVPEFWTQMRETIRQQESSMPVLGSAPLVLRETLIFPYLGGADFVRWFNERYPGSVPFGERLPESTEQVMHTDRYASGDRPTMLEFATDQEILYEDGLGEFEMRVLMTELLGDEDDAAAAVIDWGGDRYAVFPVDSEHGLVWWSVWDSATAADRFLRTFEPAWRRGLLSDRTFNVERTQLDGMPAVRLIDGPRGWSPSDATTRVTIAPPPA
jgi:hypothetical protein